MSEDTVDAATDASVSSVYIYLFIYMKETFFCAFNEAFCDHTENERNTVQDFGIYIYIWYIVLNKECGGFPAGLWCIDFIWIDILFYKKFEWRKNEHYFYTCLSIYHYIYKHK